jgi:hypothetical protein
LASKSKIPPQFGGALLQILEQVDECVDAFGFHAEFLGHPRPRKRYSKIDAQLEGKR